MPRVCRWSPRTKRQRGAVRAQRKQEIPGASPLKPGEVRSGDYTPRVDAMANDGDRQFEALEAAISVDRVGTYLGEVNDDRALARELYVWDRGLDRGEGLGRCGMIVRRKGFHRRGLWSPSPMERADGELQEGN